MEKLLPPSVTQDLDAPLHLIGFEFETISPEKVSGRLPVTARCCQMFKVLHGGVSAMISEALASHGAVMANGNRRVAGIQLSIDHFRSAEDGDLVYAQATPSCIGPNLQVWEVHLWKTDPLNVDIKSLVSSSRVTIYCNLPGPNHAKYAKL